MEDLPEKFIILFVGFFLGIILMTLFRPAEVCKRSTTPDKIEITKTDTLYYYKINIKHIK